MFSMTSHCWSSGILTCKNRTKVEGKGNGIKTVIVNMVDIARALNREAICE